ncbi:uncharacterized protein [Cardiocondyla obscurior]|uniref:uncharacterized protein n=1 Tax=Cardiocondyla obscurior TaxID=286306 RepID=UPI003965818D
MRMLERMEQKFERYPELRAVYITFMAEYIDLGHMTLVPPADLSNEKVCYLPHHGVFKSVGNNSAIRVVFNASAQLPSGDSLNEKLLSGPNLLASLSDILLNWRRHCLALTADIEKMYRQILVNSQDRDYQRILWRSFPSDPIKEYQLNTVTYGITSAPFLAIRTLQQLASNEKIQYPTGAEILLKETYMNDILTGADTVLDAKEKLSQLIEICTAGGFTLKKWATSSVELSKLLPSATEQREVLKWHPAVGHTILGLQWFPVTDSFCFKVQLANNATFTKRQILSETARLFDPLGWLVPIVIRAKTLLQSFWLKKLDWDQPLPAEDQDIWKTFRNKLPEIEKISIPLWINTPAINYKVDLHGFSDASQKAYAAVVYARVAPLKTISLPRLELSAATLLVRLVQRIKENAKFIIDEIHLWTDSTVTLAWIQGHPTRWTTFVANRVTEIQETLPEAQWYHVNGEENPADCASRGQTSVNFDNFTLWWKDPAWLQSTD